MPICHYKIGISYAFRSSYAMMQDPRINIDDACDIYKCFERVLLI